MNQPKIIIKEADKGAAVTVLGKIPYRAMIYGTLTIYTYNKNWIQIRTPLL